MKRKHRDIKQKTSSINVSEKQQLKTNEQMIKNYNYTDIYNKIITVCWFI